MKKKMIEDSEIISVLYVHEGEWGLMQKCFLGFFILVLTTHNLGIVVKILDQDNEPGLKESKISYNTLVTCLQININFVL